MTSERAVAVKQLPARLSVKLGRIFFREVQPGLNMNRPRLVLDCSQVRQLDSTGLHVLLRCLEEAMKRNGDVKLAAIQPVTAEFLQRKKVDRLFETFATTSDAVNSFHRSPLNLFRPSGLEHSNVAREIGAGCIG